jgi:hypothetical protein
MARKRFIAGFVVAFLAPSLAFATTCPGGVTKSEIGARYLLTEFMVAALSCKSDPGFRDSYGSFVRRYNPGLVSNAQAMKAQFGGGSALDTFVTRLANHAALRQNDSNFCSHAQLRMKRALDAGKTVTLANVVDSLGYAMGGPACGDNTPVAALNGKAPIAPSKPEPPAKAATPAKIPAPVAAPDKAQGADPEAAPPMPAPGGGSDLSPTP